MSNDFYKFYNDNLKAWVWNSLNVINNLTINTLPCDKIPMVISNL